MPTDGANTLFETKPSVLVSRCWTGEPCRYHGRPSPRPSLIERLGRRYRLVFVCPEILGGLPVPRPPAPLRRRRGKVLTDCNGQDVSAQYKAGARKVLEIAKREGCERAYLVKGSPACDRKGFAGELLQQNNIRVINY